MQTSVHKVACLRFSWNWSWVLHIVRGSPTLKPAGGILVLRKYFSIPLQSAGMTRWAMLSVIARSYIKIILIAISQLWDQWWLPQHSFKIKTVALYKYEISSCCYNTTMTSVIVTITQTMTSAIVTIAQTMTSAIVTITQLCHRW